MLADRRSRLASRWQRLSRRERLAVGVWLVIALVAWNGLYDVLLARSTQHYLFLAANHQAGFGPPVDLTNALDVGVRDARWVATLWAGIVLLAGMWTVRMFSDRGGRVPSGE
jgi:hypothetical protein